MPKAKVNGVEIYFELTGSGDYLLQVPGAVSGHLGYADITPRMAQHFTVIDYDPRGYGLSDRPQQKYTFEVWARDMVGLLEALGVARAHVHGGSMGSSLAVYFAANHPDRINGLIVSGCSAKSDLMAKYMYEVWKALARAYGTGSRELAYSQAFYGLTRNYLDGPNGGAKGLQETMEVTKQQVNVEVFSDVCDALIEMDMTPNLGRIKAPTLVMVGDQDILTPADQGPSGAGGRYIYDHLDNARTKEYVVIKDSGHANLGDNPEACSKAAIDFLLSIQKEAPKSA